MQHFRATGFTTTTALIALSFAFLLTPVDAEANRFGSDLRAKSSDLIFKEKSNLAPKGWWPFLSSNLGLFDYDFSDQGRGGYSLQVKGLLSYYDSSRLWVYEGGIGFHTTDVNERQISSPLIELASRYHFAPRWELGPAATFFVGNGDRYGSSIDALTTFAGASILHRIPLDNGDLLRVGARVMTDIGIPNQTANLFLFEVHWGFGGSKEMAPVRTVGSSLWEEEQIEAPVRSQHLADRVMARWKAPQMSYSTRQIEPNSIEKNRLQRLAREFKQDPRLAQKVRVIGHADERGSAYSNLLLSKARAQAVANILILNGVPQNQIEIIAKGDTLPLTRAQGPQAWDQNRRVEVELVGITDQPRIQQLFVE